MMNVLIDPSKLNNKDLLILRELKSMEEKTINKYDMLSQMIQDENLKKVVLDIIGEEKIHVGEFQSLLLKMDGEQANALVKGDAEANYITAIK